MRTRSFLALRALWLGAVLTGCGGQQAAGPAPAPAPAPVAEDAPVQPNAGPPAGSSPGIVSFQDLVKGLPEELRPQPGMAAVDSREASKEWLAANAVGKSVEFSAHVVGVENESETTDRPTKVLVIRRDGEDEPTQKLNETKVASIAVGPVPVNVYLYATWPEASDATVKELEGLKGKTVVFRGKVSKAEFLNGDTEQSVNLIVSLENAAPVKARSAPKRAKAEDELAKMEGKDRPQDPNPAATTSQTDPPAPMFAHPTPAAPVEVKDLALAPPDPDLEEELKPADEVFPRRKMIVPKAGGKVHGQVRHVGPQRRLVGLDRYEDDFLRERWLFYPSGRPYQHVRYAGGRPHGVNTMWFEDGKVSYVATWVEGVQTGPAVMYAVTGKPAAETVYVNGVVQGERRHYLPDGRPLGVSIFKDGQEVEQKVLNEPTPVEFSQIQQREKRAALQLKDFWEPAFIEAERAKGGAPPDPNKKVGEWVQLFNGKNLNGWWPNTAEDAGKWEVRDGVLVGASGRRFGYLYRDEDDYQDFRLRAEVRLNETGNSGLMVRGQTERLFDAGWPKGLEVQLGLADRQVKTGGLYTQGAELASTVRRDAPKPNPRRPNQGRRPAAGQWDPAPRMGSTNAVHHAADEWFTVEVTVKGNVVTATVNGKRTAEDEFKPNPHAVPPKGFIGLQLHPKGPTTVEFRKIEVMRLPPGGE